MFDAIFPKHWTTLQRLMWLKTNALARAVYETITGNPVSFTAKAAPLRKLEVAFSPVQDLHGYDSPWPAGGGKNKADYPNIISAGAVEQSDGSLYVASAGSFIDVRAFINDGSSGQFSITFIVKNDSESRGVYPVIKYTDGTSENVPVNSGYTSFTTVTKTTNAAKTVNYIYFTYGSFSVKTWFYIQVEQGATPTAWTPYSNECPISGWSSLTVEQRGENFLPVAESLTPATSGDITVTPYADGHYHISKKAGSAAAGVAIQLSSGVAVVSGMYISALSAKTNSNVYISLRETTASGTQIVSNTLGGNPSQAGRSATANYIHISATAAVEIEADVYPTITETAGRSISISLGQTVYSGYVDVVTGVLTVDMAMQTLDGAQTVGMGTAANFRYYDFYDSAVETNAWETNVVSNFLKPNIGMSTGCRVQYTGQKCPRVVISTSESIFSSVDELKAYLQETPLTIVYPLATPLTIQLTPQEVQSLAGDNTMWSNANQPITVTYRSN